MIRRETATDHQAVRHLLEDAFPTGDEARLVDRLRADGDLVFALVAEQAGAIIGYIAFSVMKSPFPALGLAPLAVEAAERGRGVAERLVRSALEALGEGHWRAAFVLGDPAYYSRFGFSADDALGYECVYAGPHFLAMPFGPEMPTRTGEVAYATAFADLEIDQ